MSGTTIIVGDSAQRGNPNVATVSPLGEVRVENPASQLFIDTFDTGTLDTVNKWAISSGTGGSNPTNAVGATVLAAATTLNGFSKLTSLIASKYLDQSIGVFRPTEPGFLLFNARVNISPIPSTGGTLMNWGLGTSPGTPTIASPITQFIGFELTTTGKLQAVTYQTGTRVLIQDLSGLQPSDTAAHKYFVYFRGDIAYWCIDDKDNIVAQYQTGASGPDINTLPVLFQCVSNAGVASTMQVNAISVGDTSHTASTQFVSNGFINEFQRGNVDANAGLVTISAQGAGTVNSPDFINTNGRGVVVGINTTVDAAGAYTVAIQGKDVVSGQYYTLANATISAISGTIAATGFQFITVYPGSTNTAGTATVGGSVNMPLPRTWRIQVVVTTGPITATIGASVLN